MAVYGLRAKAISMGKGQSAVHTAAYNARCQLHDERENRETKNYAYKGKAEFSGIFAPKDAPAWTQDREQLWNRATAAERQANGQPARNVEFSIPHELTAEQRRRLVVDFVRETFARRGMVADVSIHVPHEGDDRRNYHAHCLLTMRRLDGDDFAKTKERDWNQKAELEAWREKWAHMGAKALERAGHQQEADRFRHGHQTLAEQQKAALARGDHAWAEHCDRDAGIHKGAAQTAMERRGDPRALETNIGREAREVEERNAARLDLRAAEKDLATVRKAASQEAEWERRGVTSPEHTKRATDRPEAANTPPKQPAPAPSKGGLKVAGGVAGGAIGLVDFVLDILAGSGAKQPPSAFEEMEQQERAIAALSHIRDDIEAAKTLSPADVQNLTPTHLANIATKGDDYIRQLVEQMERDRERERDWGRTRER